MYLRILIYDMPDPGTLSPDIATRPKPEAAKVAPPQPEKPEAAPTASTRSPQEVRATLEALANGKSVAEAYATTTPAEAVATAAADQTTLETPTGSETVTPAPETKAETTTPAPGAKTETATQPVESLPSRETVDAILSEANGILLELRDMRLLVNAVATQAADTPLGNEVRLDALRSLEKMNTIGLPPDQTTQLNALQEKIKALNLPPSINDATLTLLNTYNEQHPDTAIPQSMMEKVRSGDKTAAESVAQMLQTNNDLAALTWKELTGRDGFTKLNLTPGVVLDLAGLPRTKENEMKAAELFGIPQQMKEPPMDLKDALRTGFMYGALGIMFFNQIALGEGGGGH